MILSKCVLFDSKKMRFIKEQETSGLLSSLGVKAPLSLLLAGGKFMLEMNLRQPY